MEDTRVLVHVDKTVVRITGLSVRGLNTSALEAILKERIGGGVVRIIGVTGSSIEMDVYGLEEDAIKRDEAGLIKAIATADGIKLSDVAKLETVKKIRDVNIDNIPAYVEGNCRGERWVTR